MKRICACVAVLAVSACSNQAMIATAFPDRETFSFASATGTDVMSYVCEPGATQADTLARAQAAHRYVDSELMQAADTAADQIISGLERGEGAFATSMRMNATLEAAAERVVTTAETRYSCLLSDVTET